VLLPDEFATTAEFAKFFVTGCGPIALASGEGAAFGAVFLVRAFGFVLLCVVFLLAALATGF
jgi:hypothetical protein